MNDNIKIFGFQVSKIGEMETDIQDAVKWSQDNLSIAIADGASTSVESKKWADLLVDSFCRDSNTLWNDESGWRNWLSPIQQEWQKYRLEIIQNAQIPWYKRARRNPDLGSATFLGLQFDSKKKTYRAISIGDCCLFHFRQENNTINIVKLFPIEQSIQFTSVTNCFNSTKQYSNYEPCVLKEERYTDGDIFLLATDALAEYIMHSLEEKNTYWEKLLFKKQSAQKDFEKIVNEIRYRSDIKLKNDDTTLSLIYLENSLLSHHASASIENQSGILKIWVLDPKNASMTVDKKNKKISIRKSDINIYVNTNKSNNLGILPIGNYDYISMKTEKSKTWFQVTLKVISNTLICLYFLL